MTTPGQLQESTGHQLLLDRFMPHYDLSIVHSGVFRVPVDVCYDAVLSLDVFEAPLIHALIDARGMPLRFAGLHSAHHLSDRPVTLPTFRIGDMPQRGWLLLGETPDVEMVLGLVAQPWKARAASPSTPLTPENFADFDVPGFLKIATSVRVDAYGSGSSILVIETRAVAADPESRRRFKPYWRVVGPFSHLIRWKTMRMLDRRLNGQPS